MKTAIPNEGDHKEVDESSGTWSNLDFNNEDSCTQRVSISAAYTALSVLPDVPQ